MSTEQKLAAIIEEELSAAPVVEEFLLTGLANITAVSIVLRPLVVARLKRPVSFAAIGMAIRRYKLRTKKTVPHKRKFPSSIQIRAVPDLVEIAYRKTPSTLARMERVQKRLMSIESEVKLIAHGLYEVVFFVEQSHATAIHKIMRGSRTTSHVQRLGCVTVDWPASTKDIPGIYYRVTRALARREISIQSFHTIGSEMMIVVQGDLLQGAYTTIAQLLSNTEFE